MSIPYTNLVILLCSLFLFACAGSTPAPDETAGDNQTENSDNTQKTTADIEVSQYQDALVLLRNNELEQAEVKFLKMAAQHPDLAGPQANLGLLYIKRNQLDEAEKHLRSAINVNPRQAQAHALLGYLYNQKGDISSAIEMYSKAVALKDDYATAHYNLAVLYDIYQQDIGKALQHYTRYLELTDNQDKKIVDWVNELKRSLDRG